MTDRPEDVIRKYLSNGEPTWTEVDAAFAALTALITERDRLRTAAGVFLSVVTLENPHRYEHTPAERMLRAALERESEPAS